MCILIKSNVRTLQNSYYNLQVQNVFTVISYSKHVFSCHLSLTIISTLLESSQYSLCDLNFPRDRMAYETKRRSVFIL